MLLLNEKQIKQKIKRLAFEIAEQNYLSHSIVLAGINNNGYGFAKLLAMELRKILENPVELTHLRLNPANPLDHDITFELKNKEDLHRKTYIIVDDVANTGRTIFYAFKPFMEMLAGKVEVAVLVDRKHKRFPIEVNYVGLSLATTLMENINVKIKDTDSLEVHLE